MDLELTIEDARELGRVLRQFVEEHRGEEDLDSERLERIARRCDRLLSTPVVHHDPFV